MLNKTLIILLFILLCTSAWGLRVSRPPSLRFPLDESQIANMNKFNEDMWNMQYGRFELDVVTTSKTQAKNGEVWIIKTGQVARIQFKANDLIFTVDNQD